MQLFGRPRFPSVLFLTPSPSNVCLTLHSPSSSFVLSLALPWEEGYIGRRRPSLCLARVEVLQVFDERGLVRFQDPCLLSMSLFLFPSSHRPRVSPACRDASPKESTSAAYRPLPRRLSPPRPASRPTRRAENPRASPSRQPLPVPRLAAPSPPHTPWLHPPTRGTVAAGAGQNG